MTSHQDSPEAPGRTKRLKPLSKHTLTPLRVLKATAPSGGEITFIKYSENNEALSWYQGCLTQHEEGVFWKAKLAAEKPGLEAWNRAERILRDAGWAVES